MVFKSLKLISHIIFNIGFWTFFWGAFEQAYQSSGHPIWSGTFGFPILHHYIIGAILSYIGYLILSKDDLIEGKKQIKILIGGDRNI